MSQTPLTDAILDDSWDGQTYVHSGHCIEVGKLARRLERDRAELLEALKRSLNSALIIIEPLCDEEAYKGQSPVIAIANFSWVIEARAAIAKAEGESNE